MSVGLYMCLYGHINLSTCLSVCLSACLSCCLFTSLLVCKFLFSCLGTLPRLLVQRTQAYSHTWLTIYTSGCSSAVCCPPSVMPRSEID